MFAVNATADQIMSANHRNCKPVCCWNPVADDAAQYWSFCVTSDGTSESEIIGIISEHDVLPLRLIILGYL
jgi:hypothetical protein